MRTVLESLNSALHQAFAEDTQLVLLGEDILDPYGGAFKVTRGLSDKYPQRVFTTPISEAGIVGVGAGLALRGLHPIVEIMFGDFLPLAADQLINHVAKFRWMYNLPGRLSLVIRTPMGGRRGYGPTHSQTLEKLFLGVPGLDILAPHTLLDPGRLLISATRDHADPVLFIENKLLYNLPIPGKYDLIEYIIQEIPHPEAARYSPTVIVRVKGAPAPQCTITTYGYMAELARQAVLQLAYNFEIFTELVIFSQLAPFSISPLVDAVRQTKKLVTVEEGNLSLGWGAEITARLAEQPGAILEAVMRVAALDTPIPASGPLENEALPGVNKIIEAGQKIVQNR
ncbi:MAG: hypothetical protein A2Z16_00115 [Chloroflexi bacterium RBG_16_54_18]|nr:MAG: hypothetical protein A2Z16_00115 [Chloroflexi bacterium RBG_16_54_18]